MNRADAVAIVLWIGATLYAIFGGADFGAGFWDLVSGRGPEGERSRGLIAAAIGPVANGTLPGPFPLFPPTNWWNLDISSAPVDSASASYIAFINNGGTVGGSDPGSGNVSLASTKNFTSTNPTFNALLPPLNSNSPPRSRRRAALAISC